MSLETRIKLLTRLSSELVKIITFMKDQLGRELTRDILEKELRSL